MFEGVIEDIDRFFERYVIFSVKFFAIEICMKFPFVFVLFVFGQMELYFDLCICFFEDSFEIAPTEFVEMFVGNTFEIVLECRSQVVELRRKHNVFGRHAKICVNKINRNTCTRWHLLLLIYSYCTGELQPNCDEKTISTLQYSFYFFDCSKPRKEFGIRIIFHSQVAMAQGEVQHLIGSSPIDDGVLDSFIDAEGFHDG